MHAPKKYGATLEALMDPVYPVLHVQPAATLAPLEFAGHGTMGAVPGTLP